jgi:RES domain
VVTTSELKAKAIAELKGVRALRLIDLTLSGALVRIGADSRLFSADREVAQLWSKALHEHPTVADGLLYPSRLDPARQAVALFEDRVPRLRELSRQTWYAPGQQRRLLAQIAEHYKIELIENHFVAPRKPISTAIDKPGLLFGPGDL